MSPQIEILLVAVVVSVSCALPGVFLILRQMALMSDAISHSVLLGIVVGFLIIGQVDSPVLLIFAAAAGVATVSLVELLHRTQLVKEDAAIGIVFPALFSIGVILVTKYASNVHLDQDVVLLGEIALAPFDRVTIFGLSLPRGLVAMGLILVVNLLCIAVFYKELKISTFDVGLATALGFSPAFIHYGLMSLVSITAVGAFHAVGAVLVVALMIVPPSTAYLLTDRLSVMLVISSLVGTISAIMGYVVAIKMDASVAGAMASMTGICFLLAFLMAPQRGILATVYRRLRQKWEFAQTMLLIHLINHEDREDEVEECSLDRINHHLCWDQAFAQNVVWHAEKQGSIQIQDQILRLTNRGRKIANQAFTR
ncbi:TPA: metal ABC transporter permease [Candidatus Poribacteria bacterium]|nr:metal ABC transporter permease [Candidatus Poribacteria bacterium]HIA68615.1 metal ABC transporter permease [Candidatus Poribacteria bacterium]HIN30612.1 metal ABC transporter permease [Candidatus Poribacteria bacterium]HIO47223.1 metal ABC transporter permease [Candidatus Poribacteria bacterium]